MTILILQPTDPPDPQRQLQGPDQTPDQAVRVGGRHLARGRHPEGDGGRPPGLHGQRQGQGQGVKGLVQGSKPKLF